MSKRLSIFGAVGVLLLLGVQHFTPQNVHRNVPHRVPVVAIGEAGAEWDAAQQAQDAADQAVRDAETARVAAEAQAAEDARLAEMAAEQARIASRPPQAPQKAPVVATVSGDCSAFLPIVGAAIIQRESGDNPNAVNSSSGALGCVQLLPGHFAQVSPWNSNASGTCSDLNPAVLADQVTCASRLPASAWNL